MTRSARSPRKRRRTVLRYLGDVFLTGGLSRGVTDSLSGGADHLLARGALFGEGRRRYDDDRPPGILDGLPGWVVLAGVAALIAAVYIFG